MHELQSLLLQKLPRLGKLTFGCEVTCDGITWKYIDHHAWCEDITKHRTKEYTIFCEEEGVIEINENEIEEILGHPFTHADILEALGEDWAMTGDYQLLYYTKGEQKYERNWLHFDIDTDNNFPKLPKNLSDLSLPEYEETRKQLIQLLTK